MSQSRPLITGTIHTLPFNKLSPRDFERLCLWLVEREGYERAEHLGAVGSEQGRDIIAWHEGELWAFQCKRVQRFGPRDALAEVEKVLAVPKDQRPAEYVFIVTCDVSATTRTQARERCAEQMDCRFWASTELDEKVKQHPDIVKEFFRAVVIYEGKKPVSIGGLLDACQAQVQGVLYDVHHKYNPDLYVHRTIESELDAFFDTPPAGPVSNCFLIVAPAGSGKTNLLCEVARVRVAWQPVLLLMCGNIYLGGDTGLLGAMQAELQSASSQVVFRSAWDSLHTLHHLAEQLDRDALLILDAINEYDRPAQMRKALEDLLRRTRGKRIKLVVTCRDYYWGLFKGPFWEEAAANGLPPEAHEDEGWGTEGDFSCFTTNEHEQALPLYLDHYSITGRPVGKAAERCRHPLLLRFFCEAYRGQDVGKVEDIRLKELFDRYWSRKLESIAERMIKQGDERRVDGLTEEVGDYLLTVAAHMLHCSVRAIPLAEMSQVTGQEDRLGDPRSIYGRIRDEFIILEEKERGKGHHRVFQLAFVYEEFMEYVMARSLMSTWNRANLDKAAILAEIDELTSKYESFAQIVGVMVYLALMLKQERDLALWSLLLNRGERWQKVVFEAFRKLPEQMFDESVFHALKSALVTGKGSVQEQVLDTLKVRRVGRAAPSSVMKIVCRLATHDQESIRRRAVLALGNTTEVTLALPMLVKALNDPSKSIHQNALTALVRLEDLSAVPFLIGALNDQDDEMRWSAAEALGRLGDTRATKPLIAALTDRNEVVQWKAIAALGELGDGRAVKPLIAALKHSDWIGRRGAAVALGMLGDARAVKPLAAALCDKAPEVRRSATSSLGRIWQLPALIQLGNKNTNVQVQAIEELGKQGDWRAVEPMIAALRDGDEEIWQSVIKALKKVGKPALGPLVTALGDSNADIRKVAIEVLKDLGEPAVEPLIASLKDAHQSVRCKAAETLGEIGDTRAVKPLVAALSDSRMSVRCKAAEALGEIGDSEAVEALTAALKGSGRHQLKSIVVQALRCIGTPDALRAVRYYVRQRWW